MNPGQWVVAHDMPFDSDTRAHVVLSATLPTQGRPWRTGQRPVRDDALLVRDCAAGTVLGRAACGVKLLAEDLYADADRHADVERCHDCAAALVRKVASA